MRYPNIPILLFPALILLMLSSALTAQDPAFIHYDTKDGLPSSEVYDVELDEYGQVWFTSDRGVCSFDGYEFTNYTTKDGLTNNTNLDIFKDSRNRMWFLGIDGTLTMYEHGKFRKMGERIMFDSITRGSWISAIVESPNGKLYARLMNKNQDDIYEIQIEPPLLIKKNTRELEKEYGIISNGELRIIPMGKSGILLHPKVQKGEDVIHLEDSWVFHLDSELIQWNEDGSIRTKVDLKHGIERLYMDNQENIWVASRGGLYMFPDKNLIDPPHVFFGNHEVTGIRKDTESGYWISTLEGGIKYVPNFNIKTIRFNKDSMSTERALVGASLDHHILFGTSQESIFSVDEQFRLKRIGSQRKGGTHINMVNRFENSLWFSRHYKVVEKGKNELILTNERICNSRHTYKLIKPLSNGEMLVCHHQKYCLIPVDKQNCDCSYQLNTGINCVLEDNGDVIWIGTMTGLYYLNRDDLHTKIDASGGFEFLKGRIMDIKLAGKDNLWIATIGDGVVFKGADTTIQICQKQGLLSDLINSVLPIGDNLLWVASTKGLNKLKYRIVDNQFELIEIQGFTVKEGLLSNYISDIDYWNGYYWLANNYGITYFHSEDLQIVYPEVPVIIKKFNVNGRDVVGENVFMHDQNDIHLSYSGVSFSKPITSTAYNYRLYRGEDIYANVFTNERSARFNDLPPGEYKFEVSAKNKSNKWSQTKVGLNFIIKPHFIQTWWFSTLLLISLLAIVAYIGIRRFRTFERKELQKRRLQETKYQLKVAELDSLRSQINPHFIFNSLNSIQRFIFDKDVERSNNYLTKFSRLIRGSLENSRVQFITLKEEIEFMTDYLEMERIRFPEKFTYDIDVEKGIQTNECYVPSMLFQPILENAIKHGFDKIEYKGHIRIVVKADMAMDKLKIMIEDNGLGLKNMENNNNHEFNHESLGLKMIRERMDLLYNEDDKADFNLKYLENSTDGRSGFKALFSIPIKITDETANDNN